MTCENCLLRRRWADTDKKLLCTECGSNKMSDKDSFIQGVLYLKMCYNRAYSHLGIPLGIFNTAALVGILLKLSNMSLWTGVYIAVGIFVSFLLIGHYDVKHGVFAKEQSLMNKHNPEIQAILKGGKR